MADLKMDGQTRQMIAELVAIPSVTCTNAKQDQSNLPVIELLATWFTDYGFQCEIMPVADGKANLIAVLANGATDLTGGLVLAGHTDTVPFDGELWKSDPFTLTERDGNLYGLGTADMKGFFALILQALRALPNAKFKAPLIVIATCDEETSMAGAKALVQAAQKKEGRQGRFALIGEPTDLKPGRLHKGVMLERILITGQAGHSSDPSLGRNALDAMHEVMTRLMRYRDGLKVLQQPIFAVPHPTLNLGCIHGGDNPNRICGLCELQFDVRTLPGMKMQTIREEIRQLIADVAPTFGVELLYEPASSGAPSAETPADSPFVQYIEGLTGQTAGALAFGTEAPYFRQLGMDTVILGPGRIEQAHQPDEYIPIANIEPMVGYLTQLIKYYCVLGEAS
ncbi:acetylornithine deacetylase [Aquirhabdus parva]|nr:acetylornithine deacetylase [Aquirhabdus parva]